MNSSEVPSYKVPASKDAPRTIHPMPSNGFMLSAVTAAQKPGNGFIISRTITKEHIGMNSTTHPPRAQLRTSFEMKSIKIPTNASRCMNIEYRFAPFMRGLVAIQRLSEGIGWSIPRPSSTLCTRCTHAVIAPPLSCACSCTIQPTYTSLRLGRGI